MLESGQPVSELTNGRNGVANVIMNDESASSFNSLIDCGNDETLTLQELLEISERLVAMSYHLSTDLSLTTEMDQAKNWRVRLDRAHTPSKCSHIRNMEMFLQARNGYFHNKPSGRTNDSLNGRSLI